MGKKLKWYDVLWVHEFSERRQTMSSRPMLQTPVPRARRGECAQRELPPRAGASVVSITGLL